MCPNINYKRFTNEIDDEALENIGVSVIRVPELIVEAPRFFIGETNHHRTSPFSNLLKSTTLPISVKLCIFMVTIVHLALAVFVLIFWGIHSYYGSLSQN